MDKKTLDTGEDFSLDDIIKEFSGQPAATGDIDSLFELPIFAKELAAAEAELELELEPLPATPEPEPQAVPKPNTRDLLEQEKNLAVDDESDTKELFTPISMKTKPETKLPPQLIFEESFFDDEEVESYDPFSRFSKLGELRASREAIAYDTICKAESDFSIGAKKSSKAAMRFSFFATIALIPLCVALLISILPYLPIEIPEAVLKLSFLEPYLLLGCISLTALLGIEVIISGIYRFIMLSPSFDTVLAINSILCLAYTVQSTFWDAPPTAPYVAICCCAMQIAISAKRKKLINLKRSYTAATLSTSPVGVRVLESSKAYTSAKTQVNTEILCESLSKPNIGERYGLFISPFLILLPIILAVLCCNAKADFSNFLWVYCGISLFAMPLGFIACSTQAEYKAGKKLFTSGTAFVDPSQLRQANQVKSIILRDSDIFPPGAVDVTGMKAVGDNTISTVLSYSTAILKHVGGGIYKAFSDICKTHYVKERAISNLQFFESGGVSCTIDHNSVLFGTSAFLTRMGVHVSDGVQLKNTIFLSINSNVACVFSIEYRDVPQTFSAFQLLKIMNVRPMMVSMNFQVNPLLVEHIFDLDKGVVIYPKIDSRLECSDPSFGANDPPIAILSRDTFSSFAEVIAYAKMVYKTVRFNAVFSTIASIFGMGIMYFLASKGETSVASSYNTLIFMFLWYLPVLFKNLLSNKF